MEEELATITSAFGNQISPATVAQYKKKAKQLTKRCATEHRLAGKPEPTPADIVRWLRENKAKWRPATWQLYRSALAHGFTASMAPEQDRSERALRKRTYCEAGLKILRAETQSGTSAESENTSATKLKKFPEADRLRIADYLARTRSPNATLLNDCLLAAVRCGLRPEEWPSAEILHGHPDTLIIRVQNAKHGGDRAHGPTRTLTFLSLPVVERDAIARWIEAARSCPDYAKLQKALSDLHYKTCRAIWPRRKRHVTLYSARHEFAAIAKLGMRRAEVAAVMGHATDLTASDHYGTFRTKGAWPPHLELAVSLLPQPAPDEVARVRRLLATRLNRLAGLNVRFAPGL